MQQILQQDQEQMLILKKHIEQLLQIEAKDRRIIGNLAGDRAKKVDAVVNADLADYTHF